MGQRDCTPCHPAAGNVVAQQPPNDTYAMGCSASAPAKVNNESDAHQPATEKKEKYSPQAGKKAATSASNDYLLDGLKIGTDGEKKSKKSKKSKDRGQHSNSDAVVQLKPSKKDKSSKRDEVYERKKAAFLARKAEGKPRLNTDLPSEPNSEKSTARSARKSSRQPSGANTVRRETKWKEQRDEMKKQIQAAKRQSGRGNTPDFFVEIYDAPNTRPQAIVEDLSDEEDDGDSEDDDDDQEDSASDNDDDSESDSDDGESQSDDDDDSDGDDDDSDDDDSEDDDSDEE